MLPIIAGGFQAGMDRVHSPPLKPEHQGLNLPNSCRSYVSFFNRKEAKHRTSVLQYLSQQPILNSETHLYHGRFNLR